MGGKAKAPPPPDYSGIANASQAAAEMSYKLGKEQLDWAKEQYAKDSELTSSIVERAVTALDENQENARKDRARYEEIYQPLEDQLAADAESYASPERMERDRGRAMGTAAQQFDQTRDAALQQLEGFGIDPSSTRYAALDIGMRAQKAASMAAAGNQSDQATEATGRALRSEAINVGRGYPGQVVNSYGQAMQQGNQATNATLAQTASGANTMGTGLQWNAAGNQSLGTWSNALTQGYNTQMQRFNANQNASSGWGSALGLVGGLATKAFGFEEGGEVPGEEDYEDEEEYEDEEDRMALPVDGGEVPRGASPTRGAAIDDVPARLTAGEFVIPKDVTDFKGEEFFQRLIENTRKKKQSAKAKPEVTNASPQKPTFRSRSALPV